MTWQHKTQFQAIDSRHHALPYLPILRIFTALLKILLPFGITELFGYYKWCCIEDFLHPVVLPSAFVRTLNIIMDYYIIIMFQHEDWIQYSMSRLLFILKLYKNDIKIRTKSFHQHQQLIRMYTQFWYKNNCIVLLQENFEQQCIILL